MPWTDAPLLGHHWKSGLSIASHYYPTLDHNVSLPVMRTDSIAQIAKALARLVLVVSHPFVTLNLIVEWSKTVHSQSALWHHHWGLVVWCGHLTFLHKAVKSQHVEFFVLTVIFFFCSIINVVDSLQQWPWVPYQRTPSSLFSSLSGGNNKDVLACPVTVFSTNGWFISYMLVFTWKQVSEYAVAVSFIGSLICGNTVCTEESAYVVVNVPCTQDSLPDRNEQSRQWSWQCSYWLPPQLWDC